MMRTKEQVKREILAAIDRRAEQIIGLGEQIGRHPELGFKEVKTARLVEETFARLGLVPRAGLALTGVRAEARGSADGPTLGLLGELDGLVVSDHPLADSATGAAHAGGAPDRGINALYAANIGLAAINAIRETFRDEDTIRVHPIITHGGSQVNVIPAEVRIETHVRGKTVEAILDADVKVDRALRAGALAVGAKVEIATLPGSLPLYNNEAMAKIFNENAVGLVV